MPVRSYSMELRERVANSQAEVEQWGKEIYIREPLVRIEREGEDLSFRFYFVYFGTIWPSLRNLTLKIQSPVAAYTVEIERI